MVWNELGIFRKMLNGFRLGIELSSKQLFCYISHSHRRCECISIRCLTIYLLLSRQLPYIPRVIDVKRHLSLTTARVTNPRANKTINHFSRDPRAVSVPLEATGILGALNEANLIVSSHRNFRNTLSTLDGIFFLCRSPFEIMNKLNTNNKNENWLSPLATEKCGNSATDRRG